MALICVSAGHHPQAPGVRCGDVIEHDVARAWVKAFTREWIAIPELEFDDTCLIVPVNTLAGRAAFVNASGADCAVEFHVGETRERDRLWLFDPGDVASQRFARALAVACDGDARPGYYRQSTRFGVDWFLQRATVPAVIAQLGAIDDHALVSDEQRAVTCARMARALRTYANTLTTKRERS